MSFVVRYFFLFAGSFTGVDPTPSYFPSLDFTDPRNSMYSMGGF